MPSPSRPWLRPIWLLAFVLGAVLAVVSLVQLASDVRWLDDPWTGTIGMWLLAFVLYGIDKRSAA